MEKPACPKCGSNVFEVNRNVILKGNTPIQSDIDRADFVQCADCGTVVAVIAVRTGKA